VADVTKFVIEKDPDVAIVPLKTVGYTGAGFIAMVFILGMIALGIVFFKFIL